MIHEQTSGEHDAPTRTPRETPAFPGETVPKDQFPFFSFPKRWSDIYDEASTPDEDLSYVEELRLLPLEPKRESVELFLRPYEDDFISPTLETIIRLYGSVRKADLDEQTKETIWLDDRTYSAYHPNSSQPPPTQIPHNDGSGSPPNPLISDDQTQDRVHNNSATSSPQGTIGDEHAESASTRYSPSSRRPNVPVKARTLYTLLRKEVIIPQTVRAFWLSYADVDRLPPEGVFMTIFVDLVLFWSLRKSPYLRRPRFKHKNLPDSDRRLIFILNPDGYDFVALTETAPYHQHKALEDVIARYHAFCPSMGVSLSTKGKPSYQLNFHLPFFAMRTDTVHAKYTSVKPHREWIDLSFIARVLPETTKVGKLGLYPAQISFTICGTSVKHYVGYGFEDNEFDPDREFGDDEFSLDGFHADQMTKGEENANHPIWDPREYFLLTLKHRVQQVRKEWERVIWNFYEASNVRISHSLRWHHRMLDVLRILLPILDDTLGTWERFLAANGDHSYFRDSTAKSDASKFGKMLHNINEEFEELQKLYRVLSRLQDQREKKEASTGARMMQQNNYIAVLMLQVIGPLSLVTSFFSMEEPVVEFKRNLVSFIWFYLVLILLIYAVRFVGEGHMYRPEWCETIARRAKRIWRDVRDITTRTTAGGTVLQRRRTHEWYKLE